MESPSGELAPALSQAWLYVSKLHSRRSKVVQGAGKLGPTESIYQDAQRASTVTFSRTALAHLQL